MKTPEEYGYVVKNNLCLFQKGPLSQWWGGYKNQNGGFSVSSRDIFGFWGTKTGFYLDTFFQPIEFSSCEQWMMANKATLFDDLDTYHEIMNEDRPDKVKALGRKVSNFDPKKWDTYKYQIVLRGNLFKFEQNPDIRDFLMQFHPATIFCEAAPWDKVWGNGLSPDDPDCLDINKWQGENLLGEAIREVRRRLK